MHIGPKRWDEWLWLADLEGSDLFLAKQWLLEQASPPRVYESEDDSDSESESGELIGDLHDDEYDPDDQFLSAYLRFRAAFIGSKQQMRKLTFDKYLDLHGQAFASAAAGRLANSSLPQHTLSEAQLVAFRASSPPGFAVDHPAYLFFRDQSFSCEASSLGDPPSETNVCSVYSVWAGKPEPTLLDQLTLRDIRELALSDKEDRRVKKQLRLWKEARFKQRRHLRRTQQQLLVSLPLGPPDPPPTSYLFSLVSSSPPRPT